MTAPTNEPKNLSKKEQRIANAKQIELDYADDDGPRGIYDMGFRAHVARVLEALGYDNGLAFVDAGWDKRIAVGLPELKLLKLAYDGTLAIEIQKSVNEIAEKTLANAEEARLEKLKSDQAGGNKGGAKNGPVRPQ